MAKSKITPEQKARRAQPGQRMERQRDVLGMYIGENEARRFGW